MPALGRTRVRARRKRLEAQPVPRCLHRLDRIEAVPELAEKYRSMLLARRERTDALPGARAGEGR